MSLESLPPEYAAPRPQRPLLIWLIAVIVLAATAFSLFSLSLVPSLLEEGPDLDDARRNLLESQTIFNYALAVATILGNVIGAVLLVLLLRVSFYVFLAAAAFSFLNTTYNIACNGWLAAVGMSGLVVNLVGWTVNLAILLYVWSLRRRGILR